MNNGDMRPVAGALAEPPAFAIATESMGTTKVIAVQGELDLLTVPDLRAALVAATAANADAVVLDLLGVSFIDSVSLAAIVRAKRDLGTKRLAVVIAPDSYVTLIFEIGGMDSIVELVGTREEALARLST